MIELHGQGVSRGIALGPIRRYERQQPAVEPVPIADIEGELARLEAAREKASAQLETLYQDTLGSLGEANALLFQIHQMMLEDPDFCDSMEQHIRDESVCAPYAVQEAGQEAAAAFAAMDDAYMQARSADVLDVSARLIRILTGRDEETLDFASPAILAADDLAPSETARLDRSKVLAFVTAGGSSNSHTAIFARTMGIPAVVGLGEALEQLTAGCEAAVDGSTGEVILEPDADTHALFLDRQDALRNEDALAEAYRGKASRTKDGHSIELCANVGGPGDVDAALEGDAEGIGLFRSEFLYLQRSDYPDEETQFAAYKDVLQRMGGKRVVIRTLDIGADKQADYFQLPHEENPAMGLRAIRICLTRPEVFRTQLRALYRASVYGKLAIMFPMITHPREVRQIKTIAAQVRDELTAEGIPFSPDVELGIMIETPAAALLSRELAREVDFFSVGTNDLTQYTLALDRQNSAVAQFDDPDHTAVLSLIHMAAQNAHAEGIWIGICGELGGDPSLTETFLRMGIDELSMSPASILRIRAKVCVIEAL
ncbi:phosphoenolpyruvate--protein phosphotransferase [Pseudoflavonifractor sp. MSJ-37]|uniref:phosphoenolpyruvate--protein phosphotransferase n=1 Tax=Pseudoflavonifractor sp. MSJ-37 TaxID=2841531 RepID=UPI001C1051B7|nr:phosphoenolpyruvate--protein phosphotransferase [Pseudoflavonifractor sp. MSJ-37]MBU5435079.1 phosphoenolpyruvate--protein phosphotransferase [Pseudoflavonifractor sp. MSJ-37]